MPINLAQMRAFIAVARHGGIAAAAQELGVSRPAVAIQIKALEDEALHRLFDRNGYRLELNGAGRRLLPTMTTLSRLLREADALVARLSAPDGGRLRIGACAPFVLVPTLAAFRREFPSVVVEASIANSSALKEAILDHTLDIGIATFPAELDRKAGTFYSVPLVSQTVRAVVTQDHPWAKRSSVSLAELRIQTAILRESGSMTRTLLLDALEAADLELGNVLEFGSREAVKEAVAEGLGIGFVLDREIGVDPRLVPLTIIGPTAGHLTASEYVFCHRDLMEVGLIRDFLASAQRRWAVPSQDLPTLRMERPGRKRASAAARRSAPPSRRERKAGK